MRLSYYHVTFPFDFRAVTLAVADLSIELNYCFGSFGFDYFVDDDEYGFDYQQYRDHFDWVRSAWELGDLRTNVSYPYFNCYSSDEGGSIPF